MIIREREPQIVYTTPASDWSAANAIIALIVVAVLGVVVYYFSIVNANRIDTSVVTPQPPTIIQMPAAAPAAPAPVTVNMPPAAPTPITVNTPPAAPTTTDVTVTPQANTGPTTTTTDSTSNQ